ncbi:MAG: hypothetical protein V5A23_03610 [Halobacteriales archaeon]
MQRRTAYLLGIVAAVVTAGVVGGVPDSAALVAGTALGAGIYVIVGVAAPQLVVSYRDGDPVSRGVGAIAAAAGVGVVVAGQVTSLAGRWFRGALLVVVVGTLFGVGVREFRAGYADAGADA